MEERINKEREESEGNLKNICLRTQFSIGSTLTHLSHLASVEKASLKWQHGTQKQKGQQLTL